MKGKVGKANKPSFQKPKFSVKCGQCLRGGESLRCGDGVKSVDDVGFEDRLVTWLAGEVGFAQALATEETPIGVEDRLFGFMRESAVGVVSKVRLRRSLGWVADRGGQRVGDWVKLDLDEMGASGDYQLMSIDPVPAVRPGVGRAVTGLFEFSHGLVYELRISGQEKPIGLTENHPIWSVDRADWIAAKALRLGERV